MKNVFPLPLEVLLGPCMTWLLKESPLLPLIQKSNSAFPDAHENNYLSPITFHSSSAGQEVLHSKNNLNLTYLSQVRLTDQLRPETLDAHYLQIN